MIMLLILHVLCQKVNEHGEFYDLLILFRYNTFVIGDDRLRRRRLNPNCELRGTDLMKSVQTTSANRTNYATLPLAA